MSEDIQQWGIVELMGHKVVAGLLQKSEMIGKPMLRVDVPATSTFGEFTQFYEMLEREEKYPILRLTKRSLDWLRGLANLFVCCLRKKVVVDDEVPF